MVQINTGCRRFCLATTAKSAGPPPPSPPSPDLPPPLDLDVADLSTARSGHHPRKHHQIWSPFARPPAFRAPPACRALPLAECRWMRLAAGRAPPRGRALPPAGRGLPLSRDASSRTGIPHACAHRVTGLSNLTVDKKDLELAIDLRIKLLSDQDCFEGTEKNTDNREDDDDVFEVVVDELVHGDPQPLVMLVLFYVLQDSHLVRPDADVLDRSLDELEHLLVREFATHEALGS
ncbi:hypothetical protein ABZP36_027514 [Zizania latifolia]